MDVIQDFLNSAEFTIFDPVRIDNLVTNAEISNRIEHVEEMIKVTFTSKVNGKKQLESVTFSLPVAKLSNQQISKILSYKQKHEKTSNHVPGRQRPARPQGSHQGSRVQKPRNDNKRSV